MNIPIDTKLVSYSVRWLLTIVLICHNMSHKSLKFERKYDVKVTVRTDEKLLFAYFLLQLSLFFLLFC